MPLTHIPVLPKVFGATTFRHCENWARVAGGHVLKIPRHLEGQAVLLHDLGIGLPELSKLLHELVVTKDGIGVVGRVVNNASETELSGDRTNAQRCNKQDCENFSFHHETSLEWEMDIY